MVWPGQERYKQQRGGRYGGFERLKDGYVVPRHAWFHVDGDNGHPDLAVHCEVRHGRPEVVEYRLVSKPDGRGLRSVDVQAYALDGLALGVFVDLALTTVTETTDATTLEPVDASDERSVWRARKIVDDAAKAPQRDASPVELRRVAAVYREHESSGSARQAVQETLGYRSVSTTARRIRQARDAGLLPDTHKKARQ